jgi:uncharacterized protein (UPF0264 family)
MGRVSGLLVSVRSVPEAAAALAGGAALIDVKEPARGPLGRADADTIAAVIRYVDRRKRVSAALGELLGNAPRPVSEGLDFVKWGLAGCLRGFDWRSRLAADLTSPRKPRTVIVGYADWERAEAPPLDEVVAFALRWRGAVFLVDTFGKDPAVAGGARPSLLSWLSEATVAHLCRSLQTAGVRVALAGSLDDASIAALRCAEPDWFAVRAAACAHGRRHGVIVESRVRELVNLLKAPAVIRLAGSSPIAPASPAQSCS